MAKSMWILPFGKNKGKAIEDVPDNYLCWLLEQEWFCDKFSDKLPIIHKELQYRDDHDLHIKDEYQGEGYGFQNDQGRYGK